MSPELTILIRIPSEIGVRNQETTVGSQLNRLYRDYGYYLGSIQKEKEDKVKYGTTDFSRSDTESYAKDVQNQFNTIIQMKFR